MKISVEWVNQFLTKKLSPRDMAAAMELAAIEVEEIHEPKPFDERIVIGKVTEVGKHPNADKLKLTKVDVGGETLSIVCGAPNVAVGQLVPVATVDAVLPDGTKITDSKIRGEASQGMICSERELGIGNDHQGILVLSEGKPGQKIDDVFTTNSVIDVKTAANRWDLTSIIGVAREVASQTNQQLNYQAPELDFGSGDGRAKVKSLLPEDLVSIYMLAPVRVDMSGESPEWIKRRLMASNVRPISVVVDITNYVMLEYGQPLHAFDADKVNGEINVRLAKKGEKLTTLDGVERELDSTDIVIADSKKALGFAGVMGGENSEVSPGTTKILLEGASFSPSHIRKTAMRHGLRSEASARFERGVPAHPHEAMARALRLFVEHAGGKLDGTIAIFNNLKEPSPLTKLLSVDTRRIGKLLGLELREQQIKQELEKLGFRVDGPTGTGSLTVTVPWWRADVTHEADIAEEVIKLIGYDKLPSTIPALRNDKVSFDNSWSAQWRAKAVLRSLDLFEVTTYSFISKKQIEDLGWQTKDFYELENPMSIEQAFLRETMLPSLLATAARNRTYAKQFGMFEFSKTFFKSPKGQLPEELPALGVLTVSPKGGYAWVKASLDRLGSELGIDITIKPGSFDKKIAHPARSGSVYVGDKWIGLIGQLHPDLTRKYKLSGEVGYLELRWDMLSAAVKPKQQSPISAYPIIERDIAIVIDREVTWQQVKDELGGYQVSFVSDYYGDDLSKRKKSLALRLKVERFDRTPTDKDADDAVSKVIGALNKKFNATVR